MPFKRIEGGAWEYIPADDKEHHFICSDGFKKQMEKEAAEMAHNLGLNVLVETKPVEEVDSENKDF